MPGRRNVEERVNQAVFNIVTQTVASILSERRADVPELRPETLISESGLDSLDIADLTAHLDELVGRVPEEALRQYPRTLGELAELYGRYQNVQPGAEALRA
jgi:acyl carrier protein